MKTIILMLFTLLFCINPSLREVSEGRRVLPTHNPVLNVNEGSTLITPRMGSFGQNFSSVTRVIDGDTFVLMNGEKVRLLGIDTPELDSIIIRDKTLAVQAKEYVERLVLKNNIRLEFDGPTKDLFGRTLCYIFLQKRNGKDSLFIQAELLKAGLARILMYPKRRKYYGLFYNLRNTATKNHLGIWQK